MKKKVLSLLLVLAVTLSLLPAVLAEGSRGPTFSDVTESHWAFSSIEELVARKAINGYPDGNFYPDRTVTREEFAKIMVVAAGLSPAPAGEASYADVPLDYWASSYIETARPYMTAFQTDGGLYFYPIAGALREDIAVAVVKLKGYDVREADLSILSAMFQDLDSISQVARPYVALAVEKKIITGYTDGTFRGQGTITRSEAAAMLWRAFQQGSGDKVIPDEVLPAATPTPTATPVPTATPAPTPTPTATPVPTPTPEPTKKPVPQVTATNYSLITDKGGNRIRILAADGTKTIVEVNSDSVLTAPWGYQIGDLIVYDEKEDRPVLLAVVGTPINAEYDWKSGTFGGLEVAEDCVLFAEVTDVATGASGASYRAYNLKDLSSIPAQRAAYAIDLDGRVAAVYMDLNAWPKGPSRVYGIVSRFNGTVKIGDGAYSQYVVDTSDGERIKVNLPNNALKEGQLVSFEETLDDCYSPKDITIYTAQNTIAGYIKEYSHGSLSLYSNVTWNPDSQIFENKNPSITYVVADDCKLVYVNAKDKKAGDEIGLVAYDKNTGYKNIAIVLGEDDVIIAAFIETSYECDIFP